MPDAAPSASWPSVDESFVSQFAATYGFRLGNPQEVTVAPDGDVLFTRTEPRGFVATLYQLNGSDQSVEKLVDVATLLGAGEESLSVEEKARRERLRQATRGISGYELSTDGKRILVPLSGRLFAVDRATVKVTALDTGDGAAFDPHLSPDGDQVAYVIDGDLWVTGTAGGKPRRLTTRASEVIEHGMAEFVAQEELDRRRGFWWSPDGKSIAYQRSDLSKVDTLWVADPAHPDRAPTPFKYPRAGTPNADVTLGVMPAAGGATTWISWDRARWPYLARVAWSEGAPLSIVVMNRAQTEAAVLAADPATGATRELLVETDAAWIDLEAATLPAWLADGSAFVWATERNGALQLELRDRDGALVRALTEPGLGMQHFLGLSRTQQVAWVVASAAPTQSHVWQVPIAGGAPTQLTHPEGVYSGKLGGTWPRAVITASGRDGGAMVMVADLDGGNVQVLPSVAEDPPWMPEVSWETVTADGRELHAAVIRPRAYDATKKYPVLLHVYGGPGKSMVVEAPRGYLVDQWYADAGFVVVAIDGRGTPNRGRDWMRAVHKDLITVCLEDQVAGLRALGAAHPEMDLDRVGIYGWSFGGYVSAMAVIDQPGVFKAAVAGAPVTDWALYDTAYTERYMQTPAENPDGYARTSAVARAAELTRPLLLIHGTTDDNVYFVNTLALAEALFRAGKPFELLPVSATHMTPDPEIALALHRRQIAFFRENL